MPERIGFGITSIREKLLYSITDRKLLGTTEEERQRRLLELASVWASQGVSFIQLREKDLPVRELVELARAMQQAIHAAGASGKVHTRLLIHSRPDVAIATGADGVHLPSGPDTLTPREVHEIFAAAGAAPPWVSVSCHTLKEVAHASTGGADGILFAPVFEKVLTENAGERTRLPGTGLERLREACRAAAPVPVFALGGVTGENAASCVIAGATGVAAIRMLMQPVSTWNSLL